ncbi:MAG: transcriptional repressor LexA [Chlamydiota bacterium]|nr:transcriptional repressor LexA [Chlamydiota bacterium]
MKGLTKKQHDVLHYIQDYITQNQHSPSFRDIQKHFGFSSLGTVYNHIKILKRKGMITAESHSSRSLVPVQTNTHKFIGIQKIPLVGIIKAGFPIELTKESIEIEVTPSMVQSHNATYALEVKGDGFIDDLIGENDILLVDARMQAQEGETVIAMVNQHETIIRRIYFVENYVRLEAATHHHQPIIVREDDCIIQGVITGVIRKL